MPLISVVVPIYNVEPYLRECLDSIAQQTAGDLEVIMVNDGSSDRSAEIAQEYVDRDPRFRMIAQQNAGLGAARNAGAKLATGEFLSFVDSDDVLPPNAYELLLEPIRQTGSDFATGNVYRLTAGGAAQSPFLARTFAETRWKTHVTEFRPLIADRIVPNKLWRRSFWEANGFEFPLDMLHEDIPVVVPAQFAARSVDIVEEPVYYYRIRHGGELSITQRRAEQAALLDRLKAIERARDYLISHGPPEAREWYERSVVADDLSYYLDVLDVADEDYRSLFLDRVNELLDSASDKTYERLAALDRLKWYLVQHRLMPELLEVLRFEKEQVNETPPVRVGRKWYGDFPFRGDERLNIPSSVYELNREFTLRPRVESMRFEDGRLRIEGYAFIGGIGAPEESSQQVGVTALRPGRLASVRLRALPALFRTTKVHRPDVNAFVSQSWVDAQWSGFVATLDLRRLRALGRGRKGSWDVYVTVRAPGVKRRRARFLIGGMRPLRAVERPLPNGTLARAAPTSEYGLSIELRERWATVTRAELQGDELELGGELNVPGAGAFRLAVSKGSRKLEYTLSQEGGRFGVRIPLAELEAQLASGGEKDWPLLVMDGEERLRITLSDDANDGPWPLGAGELVLLRAREGEASLVARRLARPLVTEARWTATGELELSGRLAARAEPWEIVLRSRMLLQEHRFPLNVEPGSGAFSTTLTPAAIRSLAGALPLADGAWELHARPASADAEARPVALSQRLYERLPLPTTVGHKPFLLGTTVDYEAVLFVRRDLHDDERGGFHQRRLRREVYTPGRSRPLREAVIFTSFNGRQYSDSPRAIHEELVRRGAPLEHLWVVRDGMCEVPPTATVVRDGSREYHEALARARYVVSNDHFPVWFARREDQTVLQTWHGTPLKRLGLDVPETRRAARRVKRRWAEQVANWQYVLSPNPFSTPILRQAYAIEGEMLETGYPRNDVLAGAGREEAATALRQRLGLPPEARVVLYAPTYRDHVLDRQSRYRLDLHLDVERLRAALGENSVLLFRKHHYVVDPVPVTGDGFVRDVSSYPDGTELLLAADVLVTDYSSIMFDFANTGRPMLFFTYDLDAYADEIRGFYFDFAEQAPGPLLRTTDELADALRDADAVRSDYAARYREFAATFCGLDDGHASARVVDRLFPGV